MHKGGGRGGFGGQQQEAWALDEVEFTSMVCDRQYDKISNISQEGVYIEGLILEAAKWNKNNLDEPDDKVTYSPLPILHISAEKVKKGANDIEKPNKFFCPVYKYKQRTDLYKIVRVYLNCEGAGTGAAYW